MKISFVIPAFNEEKNIGSCLESVLAQTRQARYECEIIVVDNASTDSTKDVAARFPEVVVVYEPEKGLVRARQAGLRVASGDLVANIDADNMLTPGWLQTVFFEFEKNPQLVALSGPYIYYDVSSATRMFVRCYYYIGFLSYLVNRYVLRVSSMLMGGNFVAKKQALETMGGFDTSIEFYGEDTNVARRLHQLGPVKFTFGLPIYSSGRRLAVEGILTMAVRYPLNYFWEVFFKKPYTTAYKDIRK